MSDTYYQAKLFPLQDTVLHTLEDLDLGFYLTGGTALARCYLNHRYSDDLDFFTNADPDFKTECTQAVDRLKHESGWTVEVGTVADTFVRVILEKEAALLKIDFVNDVPFHSGAIETCTIFHRIDNWRNILSNKLCSLSRRDVKDLTDIIFIARTYEFNWPDVFAEAKQKDLWVEPLEVCTIINEFPPQLFDAIRWINPVDVEVLKAHLQDIHDDIFWGRKNEPLCFSQ